MMKTTMAGAALGVLTACGGGSTGSGTLSDAGQAPGFLALAGEFEQSLQSVGLTDADLLGAGDAMNMSTPDQLPPAGRATYSGEIALFVASDVADAPVNAGAAHGLADADAFLLGEVAITATFATDGGSFTGSASNFSDADGVYDGALLFENGDIVRGGDALQAASDARFGDDVTFDDALEGDPDTTGFLSDFGGTLTDQNGAQTTFDGAAAGAFIGANASFVGVVSGAATQSSEDSAFFGMFVAPD